LELLANAVKSGQTLPQALAVVSAQTPPPLSQEFGLMVREYELGVALDRVLVNARERLGSKQFTLAVSALLVSREKGGDLPETLERIAAAMREINRLEEKVRIATAEGRKSARTMAAMPFVLGVMLYLMDPGSFSLLFTDVLGNVILAAAVALSVTAFLWIRRIVNVPV
jgi:tight adherence protein B